MTTGSRTSAEKRLAQMVLEVFEEQVNPIVDAWHAVEKAAAVFDDDAALGRLCRKIVRTYATEIVEAEIARRQPAVPS